MGNLWEIMGKEQWQRILDEVSSHFGVHAILTDEQGKILLNGGEYNQLCEIIRAIEESRTFVCSQSNARLLTMARNTRKPVNDFCEVGMFKTVVPLFFQGEFLGGLSACGLVLSDEPVDAFLLAKMIGIEEEEANGLVNSLHAIEDDTPERIAEYFIKLLAENPNAKEFVKSLEG